MLEIKAGGSVSKIKEHIMKYTLIESSNIEFIGGHSDEKYGKCTLINGNFEEYSFGFQIVTDEESVIQDFQKLFDENKKRRIENA